MANCPTYHFYKTKYGCELLVDLIRLEKLEIHLQRHPKHRLSYYDITFITEGAGSFTIDGQEFSVKKGQLFFSSPGQVREWKFEKMPYGLVLIFEEEFLCDFFKDKLFVQKLAFFSTVTNPPVISLEAQQEDYLKTVFLQIEQEIAEKKDDHLLRAFLYQSLAWISKSYLLHYVPTSAGLFNRHIFQFRKLADQHIREQHSVQFYADQLCITPGHLNDLVNKYYAVSAKHYLQNRLMIEAKRLLLYDEHPIADIALQLNFPDPSYFIRLFRSHTGISPLAFRRKNNP